jgi:pentose-5-phosphate-3-epimerase
MRSVERACDWLHIDVFDGVAVPNLTLGAPVVAAIRKARTRVLLVALTHVSQKRPPRRDDLRAAALWSTGQQALL